jgi:hypothetical protein
MGFIRETPKRHFGGVLCVISADPSALLPVKISVPEFEMDGFISQSIYFVQVECPFENVKKTTYRLTINAFHRKPFS